MSDDINKEILAATQHPGCMHEGVLVTSPDGTIRETSPTAERLLEAPCTGLKGWPIRKLCMFDSAYDELIRQANIEGQILNKSVIVVAGSTSQQIIFDHNGHLVVESQPGKGSTFTTLLPL